MTGKATLVIDGRTYEGWEAVSVSRTIEALSGSFDLALADHGPDGEVSLALTDGSACRVLIDGELVITGYLDKRTYTLNENDHPITVSGRDKAGDLDDCAALNQPGEWKHQKLETIAADLVAPFGISISTQVDTGPVFDSFQLEQEETVQRALERMAKLRGVLIYADASGNLVINRAGLGLQATAVVEGQNLLSGQSEFDSGERFGQIYVKGQQAGTKTKRGKALSQVKASATDSDIGRYRPLLVVAEGQIDTAKAQRRAQWEVARRRGRSRRANVSVQGWRHGGNSGPLWAVNQLVRVIAPSLGLNDLFTVGSVTFRQGSQGGGTVTTLDLAPPEAFEPDPDDVLKDVRKAQAAQAAKSKKTQAAKAKIKGP
ncbi:MAG: hypothetical protein KC462_07820 [Cyanobacteria bacterium HKST-UBA05]|nr:hypothetical protein [Cyanobacteria bacterium HKST-UBA05]